MNKDSITKKLFEDKEIFASFINGVIYQGKRNENSTEACMNVFGYPGRSNHGSATISCMCLGVPGMRLNLIIWI